MFVPYGLTLLIAFHTFTQDFFNLPYILIQSVHSKFTSLRRKLSSLYCVISQTRKSTKQGRESTTVGYVPILHCRFFILQ